MILVCSPANLEFTRNPGTVLELPGARMAGVHRHTWQGKVFRKGFKLELAENLEGGASAGGVEQERSLGLEGCGTRKSIPGTGDSCAESLAGRVCEGK